MHRPVNPTCRDSPFTYFDAIFCLNLDTEVRRWQEASKRFELLGMLLLVERVPAIVTAENHHRGCALSWRAMIDIADRRGHEHMLGFEDDVVFLDDTLIVVDEVVGELSATEWDLCYFGACVHSCEFPFLPGSTVLQECGSVSCTHALAIHRNAFAQILDDLPVDQQSFEAWLDEYIAFDQYLARQVAEGTFRALITSPRVATQPALRNYADADLSLAHRYVI